VDNAGNIYVASSYAYVVRKIDPTGIVTDYAGNYTMGYSGDGGTADLAQVSEIENIDEDAAGNIYIVDYDNEVIRKVTNCLTATFSLQPLPQYLCSTGTPSFTVMASNANSLQWQVNTGSDWVNLADNDVYSGSTTSTLVVRDADLTMNNDQFRCVANNSCGNIYSLPVTLTVTAPTTPSVTINTETPTICSGVNTTFQAVATNAGISPDYRWQKNGVPVGMNSPVYSYAGIQNGDIITCTLTSASTCLTNSSAISNAITMTVDPILTAAISIAASANNICTGTPVTFTANPTNEGNNPSYQWYKNGSSTGTNSPYYNDNTLQNGDLISCQLTSSYSCLTSPTASSNTVTMATIPLVTPSISVSTSAATTCADSPVVFNTSILNGGATPVYQWQKNGTSTGANSPDYTDDNAATGDLISCTLISDESCLTFPSATSNVITVALAANPVVTLDQDPDLCTGSTRILDAGNFSSYLWNDNSTSRTLTVDGPGTYSVTVTDAEGCKGTGTTTISTWLPAPAGFLPPDTSMCTYGSLQLTAAAGYDNYLWSNNSSGESITITEPGLYWLEVTDTDHCVGRDTIVVGQKDCLEGFFIPNAFTPNNDGKNDYFKPEVLGNIDRYQFAIFNRWGQAIFKSTNPAQGWDGTLKGELQPAGTYVWICTYQFAGSPTVIKKGTVILIR